MKRTAIALAAAVMLAGCGNSDSDTEAAAEPTLTKIETAAEDCFHLDESTIRDAGMSVSFDTRGEDDPSGDRLEDVVCMLVGLDAPDHVLDHMQNTRAMDGMQESEWDTIEARWNYHPDTGMGLTLVDAGTP